jgi:hypothetical protein
MNEEARALAIEAYNKGKDFSHRLWSEKVPGASGYVQGLF